MLSRSRVCLALLLSLAFAVVAAGCQLFQPSGTGGQRLPQSYVQAHRATHDLAGHVYQKFELDHPDEAVSAKNLYDSEEKLISNAEKGTYPTSAAPITPQPVSPSTGTTPQSLRPSTP